MNAASEGGLLPSDAEDSVGPPQSGVVAHSETDAQLAAMLAWAATNFTSSSLLTTLDGGAARGFTEVPQVVQVIMVHLCSQSKTTWRNRLRLPSRACKFTLSMTVKAYSDGQAASTSTSALTQRLVPSIREERLQ